MATAVLVNNQNGKTKKIFPIDNPTVKVREKQRLVRVDDFLPFRVKFSAIQIEAIGLGNTPAIPLQVIGYSNYIL